MTIGWYDNQYGTKFNNWTAVEMHFEGFEEEFFPYWGNKLEPYVLRHTTNWLWQSLLTLVVEAVVLAVLCIPITIVW